MLSNLDRHFAETSRRPFLGLCLVFPYGWSVWLSDVEATGLRPDDNLPDDSAPSLPVGSAVRYKPLVADWGTLNTNTELRSIIKGGALELKQMEVSVINAGQNKFVSLLQSQGVANIYAHLYIGRNDNGRAVDVELVDSFVIQPPIKVVEASITVKLTLVSILARTNPMLGGEPDDDLKRLPIVYGTAWLPLVDLKTSPWTALDQDIDHTYTGPVYVRNKVGLPSGGDTLVIDSELMRFELGTEPSQIKITARALNNTVARPHSSGAVVSFAGRRYEYAVCAGPVASVNDLRFLPGEYSGKQEYIGDGSSQKYNNPYTALPNTEPVRISFPDRPPWLGISDGAPGGVIPGTPETQQLFGTRTAGQAKDGGHVGNHPALNTPGYGCTLRCSDRLSGGPGAQNIGMALMYATPSDRINAYYPTLSIKSSTDPNAADQTWATVAVKPKSASGTGNITDAYVNISVTGGQVSNIKIEFRVRILQPDGTDLILYQDEVSYLNGKSGFPPWRSFSRRVSIGNTVKRWADLASCGVAIDARVKQQGPNFPPYVAFQANVSATWDVEYFSQPSHVPKPMAQARAYFGKDLSSLGTFTSARVHVTFYYSVQDAEITYVIYKSAGLSFNASEQIKTIANTSKSSPEQTKTINPVISSWAELKDAAIGFRLEVHGPDTGGIARFAEVHIKSIVWEIEYTPKGSTFPDEKVVVYVQDKMVANITGYTEGGHSNPATIIRDLLHRCGLDGFIDKTSFTNAYNEYVKHDYKLHGSLHPDTRLHDALRQVLMQGAARLFYHKGRIGLLSPWSGGKVVHTLGPDNIFLRSFERDKSNSDLIANDITIRYFPDVDDSKTLIKTVRVIDSDSVVKYGRQQVVLDFDLLGYISSDNGAVDRRAKLIANYLLARLKDPVNFIAFDATVATWKAQKGDVADVTTEFEAIGRGRADVVGYQWTFQRGKSGGINKVRLICQNMESFFNRPYFFDQILLVDKLHLDTGARIDIKEEIIVTDLKPAIVTEEGYGTGGYGRDYYGT